MPPPPPAPGSLPFTRRGSKWIGDCLRSRAGWMGEGEGEA
uniref:Uncharacterized protein n=1 Tax=Arundo donax TaxID=35708 RepID=A0A0A9EJZ7_ARUDO